MPNVWTKRKQGLFVRRNLSGIRGEVHQQPDRSESSPAGAIRAVLAASDGCGITQRGGNSELPGRGMGKGFGRGIGIGNGRGMGKGFTPG